MQATLEQLKTQLKEKEQLQRISTYKLSELKRTIKHNQLKPIKVEEKPTPLAVGNEGKPINSASLELQRAITGKAFDRKPTLVEKKMTEKGEIPLSSVEGSFYGDNNTDGAGMGGEEPKPNDGSAIQINQSNALGNNVEYSDDGSNTNIVKAE